MAYPLKIIIIEDSPEDKELILDVLTKAGFEVTHRFITNINELETALKEQDWDIISTDYNLHGTNGIDVVRFLRNKGYNLPIIAISGSIGEELAVSMIREGAQDYIFKDNLTRLPLIIERELREYRILKEKQENEEKMNLFVKSIEETFDAIIFCALDNFKISYWNNGASNLFGYTRNEAIGKPLHEVLVFNDVEKYNTACNKLFEENHWVGELSCNSKDGKEIIIQSRWSLVKDNQNSVKGILLISSDITHRKNLESQFLRVQRMESIGRLAGGIAHDLNNILAPILMSVQLLREEVKKNPHLTKILDTIELSAQRGADIVKQVLTFARGVEGEHVSVNLHNIIKDMIKIIRETFPKNIQAKAEMPPDLYSVIGDPTQLHQVFMNLAVNARDAMPAGGLITFQANNCYIDELTANQQMPPVKPGSYVCISVIDTGIGIPKENIDKIFEPFFTTKRPEQGTGLGLSTVLGIVKSHNGFITVKSQPGQGTQFDIFLPAAIDIPRSEPISKTSEVPNGNGETILVVEDEEPIRQVTKDILEKHGYNVLLASDGTEAMAIYSENKNSIDAILMDMVMPYMDGAATIRAIRKLNPNIKIISSTGVGSAVRPEVLAILNVNEKLLKPYTSEQLLNKLHSVLKGTANR
jgi:PAS domain S-box-containing protein